MSKRAQQSFHKQSNPAKRKKPDTKQNDRKQRQLKTFQSHQQSQKLKQKWQNQSTDWKDYAAENKSRGTQKPQKSQQQKDKKVKVIETGGHKILNSFYQDSRIQAETLFNWLVSPITLSEYRQEYWEKKHLLIARHDTEVDYDFSDLLISS